MEKMSYITRFKMLTIWNKVGVLGSFASISGLLALFIPSYESNNHDDLYIKGARFEPVHNFFVAEYQGLPNGLYETAFLYFTVLNVSGSDVFITSLDVVDVDKRGVLSNAYSSSGLSGDISKNTVVRIPAGQEVELGYSGGFKFSGLVKSLNLDTFLEEYYFSNTSSKISSRTNLVQEFNDKLATVLGGETKIRIKLYVGNQTPIAEHEFDITEGTDIFETNGKIQHSYFLGDLIHHLNSPYSKDTLNKAFKNDS
ncbi:hypothetical protein [Vibrio tetraodonis]|uniref:hypothetical protein n=1 Tax=Vibrio tetraodonis TaxID=2231647 RepID=UPI00192822F6|nr:hypothetical protein [Vibrio tetraodonis]